MTRRDEVIRMARECGMEQLVNGFVCLDWKPDIERFAAIVAAAERKRCAKEVEAIRDDYVATGSNKQACSADYIAAAIRALKDGEE